MRTIFGATLWAAMILGAAATAPAGVLFEQKYQEGSTAVFDVEVETEQVLSIAGMDVENSGTTFTEITQTIGERQPDGTLDVMQKVTHLQAEGAFPGGLTISFDSSNPNKQADVPELEMIMDVYRAAIEMTATRKLDKNNNVQSVTISGVDVDDLNAAFRDQFDPSALKQEAVQEQNRLPKEPVEVGDTWKRTEIFQASGGSSLTFQRQYEYKGPVERDGKTLDRIVAKATSVSLQQDPSSATPLQITGSDLKVDSAETELLFDRKLGMVISAEQSFHITGDLTLTVNGMELEGGLDLEVTIRSKLK